MGFNFFKAFESFFCYIKKLQGVFVVIFELSIKPLVTQKTPFKSSMEATNILHG